MLVILGNTIGLIFIGIGLLFVLSIILLIIRKILHWVVIPISIVLACFYLGFVMLVMFLCQFKNCW